MRQKRKYSPLSEKEKIEILIQRANAISPWRMASHIGAHGRSESTIRRFLDQYDRTGQLSPPRGRPSKKTDEQIQRIIQATTDDPRSSVRFIAGQEHVSRELVREIRHEHKIHYYASIPVPPLSDDARRARINFCQQELDTANPLPIIFTDESTVQQDLRLGGIWRMKGQYHPAGFYQQEQHPVSVMVWGAIAHDLKLPLLRCPESVTAISYLQMLADSHVLYQIVQHFNGKQNFRWQQDNAPPHQPTVEAFRKQHYLILEWPAHSPDLSPIEMVWAIIKTKLKGRRFVDEDDLFRAIEVEWNSIPQDTIDRLMESFHARCQVCVNHEGASLNGHWQEVHRLHQPAAAAEFEE